MGVLINCIEYQSQISALESCMPTHMVLYNIATYDSIYYYNVMYACKQWYGGQELEVVNSSLIKDFSFLIYTVTVQ